MLAICVYASFVVPLQQNCANMLLNQVIHAIQPIQILGNVEQSLSIDYLLTDSRQLNTTPQSTLFFAIKTDKNDGANYIDYLYNKGVMLYVVSKNSQNLFSLQKGMCVLLVENVLHALQDLASYKRSLYTCPVIAITGSNGKTIVKEWLYQLLKEDYHITRSPKSYNSQIGVPLSVWQINEQTELAIIEAGVSQPGEMERLEPIIRPTLGVVTYIGTEHGENFASIDDKRAEKLKLFAHCPFVEDASHQNVRTCAAVLRALGYDEDTINERILHQTHETVLQINLKGLIDNVKSFKDLLKPTTKLTCMVKAFAYGAGSVEISKALQQFQVADYLAVAVADEGCELRKSGITLPIIIMAPELAALDLIIENNLEPNIYSFQSLENIIAAVEAKGLESYPIHIKIDSGMHRLGFYMEEIPMLIQRLNNTSAVQVKSVFSHLAGSDEEQWDAFTIQQVKYFETCARILQEGLPNKIIKHICNSAGIERFAQYQFDMCRIGIGMYGISFAQRILKNVCTLRTTIISIKTVLAGETIGYGRHTLLQKDRKIAVIPIGYADGFDRRLSNYAGQVIVRGKRCPIVGNICMDQAMVDVTDTDAQVGDAVEIFGDKLPLEELSNQLQTIPYEILTSISRRVQRVYVYE